jgi:Ca-activated chloride channel family protein
MNVLYPWVLFALVVPGALLIWVWASRWIPAGGRTVLPFDHGRRGGGWIWWAVLGLAESIPPLLLAAAVFLLAGPQKYGAPETKRRMTNIQFCVDVSGSMIAPFGEGNRYDGAMKAIDKFLDYRKGDSFGLTFFGDNFIHWCPLTTDPSAIRCSLPFMRPEVAPYWFGGTNIGKALQGCKKLLAEREEGDRMILLVTDGFDFDLETVGPQIAKEFKDANITVFAVIVGYHQIQDAIVTVTRGTGGDAFTVDDPEALKSVFQKIDQMKQAKVEKTIAEPMDNYRPYAVAGMILLGLGNLCLFGLRYTPW